MRLSVARAAIALALAAVAMAACGSSAEVNGGACLKNDDCESKHCIANVCRPQPVYGGAVSAGGSSGSSSTGGSGGTEADASTD